VVSGVGPKTIYNWPAKYLVVNGVRYYDWSGVLQFVGTDAIELLDLPMDAREVVQRASDLETAGKMLHASHAFHCGDPNPNQSKVHCTKPPGHVGFHQALFSDGSHSTEWGPKLASLKRMSAAKAKKQKPPHPYTVEADVPDPACPYLPHIDVRSKFMGKTVKLVQSAIDTLPEYSWRLPAPTTMGGGKWRANRNVQQPNGPQEWWQGQWVVNPEHVDSVVQWCNIQLIFKHEEKVLPDYQEGVVVTEDQFIEDKKGKGQ
jgi:hypothetical protein